MEINNSLSQYKTFYTVANTKNISKASEILFISQPAISKSLKTLEESLNVLLFIRNSRGVSLTEEGKVLYSHIKNAFEEIHIGENYIKQVNSLGLGFIRISVSATLCKYILLPYLKDFIKENPHIKINIECHSTTSSLKLLAANKADIGLIGHTDNQQQLEFISVTNVHYIFVATKSYIEHLNMRGFHTTKSIFEHGNIMLLDKENVSRLHVDHFLLEHELNVTNVLEVNNMELLIDFAKIDMGIACVISDFVKDDLKYERLIEVSLPEHIMPREIGFAYKKNAIVSSAMQKFISFIKDRLL